MAQQHVVTPDVFPNLAPSPPLRPHLPLSGFQTPDDVQGSCVLLLKPQHCRSVQLHW